MRWRIGVRPGHWRVFALAQLVLSASWLIALPQVLARPPLANPQPQAAWRSKIESRLLQLYDAWRMGGGAAARRFASQHAIDLRADGSLRLELRTANPAALRDRRWLAAIGAQVEFVGLDRADVHVPLARLGELAQRPELAWVQIPLSPQALGVQSQGVLLAGLQPYHCQNLKGQGASIAVVDVGFAGWGAAAQAGELPLDVPTPADGGYSHGTQCAEIVADMAPGAKLIPVEVHSVAALQAWVAGALGGPSPLIVSHSLGWFGETFGDGSGWLCDAAAKLRSQGGVWVTAAGNLGSGSVWRGPWRDDDGDGWLEFATGDDKNRFDGTASGQVLAVLDWDAYPATDMDLDLQLCRVVGDGCEVVADATGVQIGSQPPVETVSFVLSSDAIYAWRIRKHVGPTPKELRLTVVNPAQGPLQFFSTAKTLSHPADCSAAVAVAAVAAADYATGPVAAYSSRGPTSDGRAKPDLAAPAAVATSQAFVFQGTSAACPHVAAAIAVQAQLAGLSLAAAASAVTASAVPLAGAVDPDFSSGNGTLFLGLAASGAACQPDANSPCQGTCGTSGVRTCSSACQLSACLLPPESCNGQDDDCDGLTDDGFACSGAALLPCDTSCGSKGTRSCDAQCTWGACKAPAESCNGADDDCDGQTDEGFPCALGSAEPCFTAAGQSGTFVCSSSCAVAACIADEQCNGADDDGDGQTDEGLGCPKADSGWCQAARVSPRHPWVFLSLIASALAVFASRRRDPVPRGGP